MDVFDPFTTDHYGIDTMCAPAHPDVPWIMTIETFF